MAEEQKKEVQGFLAQLSWEKLVILTLFILMLVDMLGYYISFLTRGEVAVFYISAQVVNLLKSFSL